MREKIPTRSINTKDIFLILLGWVIKKVLDFVWAKTKVKVQGLKLNPRTLGAWFFRLSCRLMGFRAVTSLEELHELTIDLRHDRVNEKSILLWENGGFRRFKEGFDILRLLMFFDHSKADFLILAQREHQTAFC